FGPNGKVQPGMNARTKEWFGVQDVGGTARPSHALAANRNEERGSNRTNGAAGPSGSGGRAGRGSRCLPAPGRTPQPERLPARIPHDGQRTGCGGGGAGSFPA